MNYLDRNEFNFEPSQKVLDAVKNFDAKDLCFYTRIYDQGKKSVISVRVSEIYGNRRYHEFIFSTIDNGFTVISAQAGIRPLLTAFLTDLMLDHAVQ